MSTDIAALVGVSCRSVATVIACAGVGAYARYNGVLDSKAQKFLDKLVSSIFLPALILGKVTPNFSIDGLRAIWPMCVMCICVVSFGLVTGRLATAAMAVRWPAAAKKYQGLTMVAIAFPNSFSVPMTLALALEDHPVLTEGGTLTGEALSQRLKMLFLLSYAIWVFARWSIGFPVLSGALTFREWRAKVMNPPVIACLVAGCVGLIYNEWLKDELDAVVSALTPISVAIDYAGRVTVPAILMCLGARLYGAVKEVCARPQMADSGLSDKTNLAAVVGGEVQSGDILIDLDDLEVNAPTDAMAADDKTVLKSATPVAAEDRADTAEPETKMPAMAYFGILFMRQGLGAAFGAVVACLLLRDLCGVTDNAVLLVSLLQSAGPPMINISVMAGLSGSAETETAKLLLLTYAASIFTWTASIAMYLHLLA